MNYTAWHLDPTPISCGAVYDLPDGRTLWHYPPLPHDASDEAVDYRNWRLAQLDLRGHLVCDGDMFALAQVIADAQEPRHDTQL